MVQWSYLSIFRCWT